MSFAARDVLRPELVLVVLVVAALAGGAYFFLERAGARADIEELGGRLASTRQAVASLREERAGLDTRLAQATVRPEGSPLPSSADALALSARLTSYFSEAGLHVGTYSAGRESVTLGEAHFPAIGYAVSARGFTGSLIGMLDVVHEVPTAFVRGLDFTTAPDFPGQWVMSVDLMVIYREK